VGTLLLSIGGGLTVAGFAAVAGYVLGRRWRKDELQEEVAHEIQKRRNSLTDRGRTTDRRPEHDGLQPSRVGRVRIVSTRPTTADKPRDQL